MKDFSKCSKNDIVFMRIKGFSKAGGHTTLWNGDNFADNTNWLDGNVFIETFYFWQLS